MSKKIILGSILVLFIGSEIAYVFLSGEPEGEIVITNDQAEENPGTAGNESLNQDEPRNEPADAPATGAADNATRSPGRTEEARITKSALSATDKPVSWGFTPTESRKIDTIIIHSSYNALGGDKYDLEKLIAEYKEYGVAPHYLIDRKGKIYRLVEEKNIAYHAGESKTPDGRTGVNNFSIGIEIMTTEEEKPAEEQYAALNKLIGDLKSRYSIRYVLGHSDIAPGRKTDPWNFDWKKLK